MSRPIIKVCGVTTEREVECLAQCGVDFFGLVVDVSSRWAITTSRAKELAARGGGTIRPTLVTRPNPPDKLAAWIREIGATAIQLGAFATPECVRRLRQAHRPDDLVILQVIPYARGQFLQEDRIGEYLDAGADFILLDKLERTESADASVGATIPETELAGFRQRHPGRPILVAGGVSAENVQTLVTASGAVGIDVCSSVRHEELIDPRLVAELMEQTSNASAAGRTPKTSLRDFLSAAAPGNHVIAYLTIGDPPERFVAVAHDALAAGALTLELGFPHADPREGATLAASHRRALDAGIATRQAMDLFGSVARSHPEKPLIAVIQAGAIQTDFDRSRFLDELADAGAAAVLPVGMPFWQLPELAAQVEERGLQTVIACPPDASARLRAIVLRYCSGCLYVPRGRVTGGAREFDNIADFCRLVSCETELPMIVGVGVNTAQDVAEICRTKAKAAAVGSALVDYVSRGGSAGDYVRRLIGK